MNGKQKKRTKEPITIDYENKRLPVFYLIPLLLIAGFVPLIVYAKHIDLSGTTQSLYWTGQQQYLDFFSYWKSRWVIALTVIALIFYIILYNQKKLPFKNLKNYYIPLGIYAICVLLSTIFAIDTQTALWGFVDMYQGMFVLLSYALITFLTINFVNNERDVALFANTFLFLMIAEGILGIGQYFGFDIFKTKLGNDLILPNYLIVNNLSFTFGPKSIYGTLFNSNFVGSFASLMLPLSIAFLLGSKTNKQRVISVLAIILMIFVWIGCNSRAGYLGILTSTILALWFFRRVIKRYWVGFLSLIIVFVVVLIGLNYVSEGGIFARLFNIKEQLEAVKNNNDENFKYEDIILEQNSVTIKTNKEILKIKVDGNKLYFMDENNNEFKITTNGNKVTINDIKYAGYVFTIPENYPGITYQRSWRIINFYFSNDGVKIIGSGGRLAVPIEAERLVCLDGFEGIASNRGYIWGRTIPMLDSYLIKGAGPDNYPLAFPQDDFVAKLNTNWDWDASLVVDKPHNLFLQIATNTGVLSLMSLLFMWGIYFTSSFKLYSKISYDSFEKYLGASCLLSVIGYLTAGLFNDNIISVTPIFWIVLGLGISINLRLKNKTS